MKILAFAHALKVGGAQVSTLEFLQLLKDKIELKIITSSKDNEFIKELKTLGVPYRRVTCHTVANYPDILLNGVEKWINWADIVWITDEVYLVAPRIKKIKNIPVIAHLHSYLLLCPWWGLLYGMREICYEGCNPFRIMRCKQLFNRELTRLGILNNVRSTIYQILDLGKGPLDYLWWRETIREVIDSIDGFIAVSSFVKKIHKNFLPIEIVYNPVTYPLRYVERFKGSENNENANENLIVYVSGSNPIKGPHLLLKAMRMLLDEGKEVKLKMFGCTDIWIEKYVSKLNIEKNVVCMDRKPFDTVYELMSKAKAVVMPSICPESFGRVPVEANRLGTIAVVTNRGGLPEVVASGETGYVVDPYPEAIARGIWYALKTIRRREVIKKTSLNIINPQTNLIKLIDFLHKFL